jgi:hypothetical protein
VLRSGAGDCARAALALLPLKATTGAKTTTVLKSLHVSPAGA